MRWLRELRTRWSNRGYWEYWLPYANRWVRNPPPVGPVGPKRWVSARQSYGGGA